MSCRIQARRTDGWNDHHRRAAETARSSLDVVAFALGQTTFVVDAVHVRAVCSLRLGTPRPGAVLLVRGLIEVGGRVVRLVDLAALLDLPAARDSGGDELVILGVGEKELGLVADRVLGVRSILESQIGPLPSPWSRGGDALLCGATDDRALVVDVERLLDVERNLTRESVTD